MEYATDDSGQYVPSTRPALVGLRGAQIGMAARDMPVDCSPALAPFIERILHLSANIADIAHGIEMRGDRLFGAVPEGNRKDETRPTVPGEIGRLAMAVDALESSIARLNAADQRLSSL